jgi:hypothetical protein
MLGPEVANTPHKSDFAQRRGMPNPRSRELVHDSVKRKMTRR